MIRGDFASLRAFQAGLRKIASGAVANRIAALAAPKLTALARDTAAASSAVDGTPWLPSPEGMKVTLRKTGALLGRLAYVAIGPKLRVALTARYAKYQIGKRPVFPTQGAGLPGAYVASLESATAQAFGEVLP